MIFVMSAYIFAILCLLSFFYHHLKVVCFRGHKQYLMSLIFETSRDIHDRLAVIEIEFDRIVALDLVHRQLCFHEVQRTTDASEVEKIPLCRRCGIRICLNRGSFGLFRKYLDKRLFHPDPVKGMAESLFFPALSE